MGKKGDLLRALKAAQKTYTFTHEQLKEHDRVVAIDALKRAEMELKKKVDAEYEAKNAEIQQFITDEWKSREEIFMESHPNDNVISIMGLLMATSSRVLIEKFGWKPIPKDGKYDRRNRTMRYADCLVDELQRIMNDENADIRRYCEETYNLYGVKFEVIE